MNSFSTILALALALLPSLALSIAVAAPNQQPYSTWMASSFLSKAAKLDRFYASNVLYDGILRSAQLHRNTTLQSHFTTAVSSLLSPNGTLIGWDKNYFSLDDIRVGNSLLAVYALNGTTDAEKTRLKSAADGLRDMLNRYPRTKTGGLWHRNPQYKNQMWLDGLYMGQPFLATYTALFDRANETAWSDIAHQFSLIEQHCRNQTSGLLQHGYDESKTAVWANNITGASPHVWDRAVGWYFMALIDILQVYPANLSGYSLLKTWYTTLAQALVRAQDAKSGGWWLVMDQPYPGMKGNYIESSGTAMLVYGLLKGLRTGYLESKAAEGYTAAAKRGWDGMLDRFVEVETNGTLSWEGTVQVGSLNTDASYEYYIGVPVVENDPKGAGPFMFAAVEMELWEQQQQQEPTETF